MFSRRVYRYHRHLHFRTFPPSPASDPGNRHCLPSHLS
jgi:hypothetical protein